MLIARTRVPYLSNLEKELQAHGNLLESDCWVIPRLTIPTFFYIIHLGKKNKKKGPNVSIPVEQWGRVFEWIPSLPRLLYILFFSGSSYVILLTVAGGNPKIRVYTVLILYIKIHSLSCTWMQTPRLQSPALFCAWEEEGYFLKRSVQRALFWEKKERRLPVLIQRFFFSGGAMYNNNNRRERGISSGGRDARV